VCEHGPVLTHLSHHHSMTKIWIFLIILDLNCQWEGTNPSVLVLISLLPVTSYQHRSSNHPVQQLKWHVAANALCRNVRVCSSMTMHVYTDSQVCMQGILNNLSYSKSEMFPQPGVIIREGRNRTG